MILIALIPKILHCLINLVPKTLKTLKLPQIVSLNLNAPKMILKHALEMIAQTLLHQIPAQHLHLESMDFTNVEKQLLLMDKKPYKS